MLEARFRARVRAATECGSPGAAQGLLRRAERRWGFNWEDGSRASHVGDLDHLEWIVRRLAVHAGDAREVPLLRSIAELREYLANRGNFRLDGRMMTREAAATWMALRARLDEARREFRRRGGEP